jgi:hypothetical protein
MMKFLLPLFFIPLSFAGSPPGCNELGVILQGYEKDLNAKAIKDCGKLTPDELLGGRAVIKREFLEDKKCLELGDIETQIERLKSELAVMDGIVKLKSSLEEDKKKAPNSRAEGMSFVASLNTAQSLELLLDTKNSKNESLASYLKNEAKAKEEIEPKIKDFCKDLDKKGVNACNTEAFKPSSEAIGEIYNLLSPLLKVDSDQISKWQNMLAIKRKNQDPEESPYSFHIMQTELAEAFNAIDSKGLMTKKHLQAISRLDDFENRPSGMGFVDNINSIKDKKKTKILSDKLFLLMGDAKSRQQYEMQSKLSVLFDNYKDIVGGICPSVSKDFESAKKCFDALKTNKSKVSSAGFHSQLGAIEASMNFIKVLSDQEESCKNDLETTELLPEKCYQSISEDKADISDQILQLNVLKDKIGSENQDLMTYRNLALNKWYQNNNCGKIESPMDLCEADTPETISKSALMTVSDSMTVAIMFTPKPEKEVNTKAQELCDDDNKKKTKSEERLCEFFDDTTPNVVTKKDDDSDGPVEAPDGGHEQAKIKDAWLQGGANILAQGLSYFMQRNTPPPIQNPYPYNYAPYNGGGSGMGIADSIMFNARYQGAYGFYMPTPGLVPGHAFPSSSMTGYRPLSGSGGRFFNP